MRPINEAVPACREVPFPASPRHRFVRGAGRWFCRTGLAGVIALGVVLASAVDAVAATHRESGSPVAQSDSPAAPLGSSAGRRVRMMPLGDSITAGIGGSTRTGYRSDLGARLTAAGVAYDFVGSRRSGIGPDLDHEGHPGWRTDEIRGHIDAWLAAATPDVVLLNIATNDYVQSHQAAWAPARTSDLIDRILGSSPTIRIVVAKLLVCAGERRAAGIRSFNATLPRIVASKGGRVSMVDMSRISARNTGDGVHPNDRGYRQMGYQWYQALRGVLPGGSRWTATRNPFPAPTVRLLRSPAVAARGSTVAFTARLTGASTSADLARVPVRLLYRRAGSRFWTVLGSGTTTAAGSATFRHRVLSSGSFAIRVDGGRTAGRQSAAVTVRVAAR